MNVLEDFSSFFILIFHFFVFNIMGQAHSGTDKEVTLQNIQELYRKFASECPSGNLHLHEFKKIFGINSNSTEEESAYMDNVFRSFDTNKVSKVSCERFKMNCFSKHLQLHYIVI